MKHPISRRSFLKLGMLAAAMPASALASAQLFGAERRLKFHNLHTEEKIDLAYWVEDRYVPESLAEINRILRDHRTNEVAVIDTRLLDLLHRVSATVESSRPFEIISAYRSPLSNKTLAETSKGVAKHSLHMEGKAIDVRLPNIALANLRRAALKLKGGGVGYYPSSNFVHLDVGRVRTWGA